MEKLGDQHDGHDDRRQRVAGQAPLVVPGPLQGREAGSVVSIPRSQHEVIEVDLCRDGEPWLCGGSSGFQFGDVIATVSVDGQLEEYLAIVIRQWQVTRAHIHLQGG